MTSMCRNPSGSSSNAAPTREQNLAIARSDTWLINGLIQMSEFGQLTLDL